MRKQEGATLRRLLAQRVVRVKEVRRPSVGKGAGAPDKRTWHRGLGQQSVAGDVAGSSLLSREAARGRFLGE